MFYIGRAAKGTLAADGELDDPNGWRGWGTVHLYDPSKPAGQRVSLTGTLDVFGDSGGGDELVKKEEGLLGIALDPNFDTNKYIYLHYTPYTAVDFVKHIGTRRIARFTFDEATGKLDLSSEKRILEWKYQNHSLLPHGRRHGLRQGRQPLHPHRRHELVGQRGRRLLRQRGPAAVPGRRPQRHQLQRRPPHRRQHERPQRQDPPDQAEGEPHGRAGDRHHLRHPERQPLHRRRDRAGKTGPLTRREIYVMGVRNPTRMWLDKETGWLMTGWVGPDAANPSATLGPARYENLAAIPKAGNYGWPFCTGNNQPYRDRDNDGQVYEAGNAQGKPVTGWYDCAAPKNNSPRNTGLTNLPPATPTNMWYAGGGGGPVFPIDQATGRPNYGATPTYTLPFLAAAAARPRCPARCTATTRPARPPRSSRSSGT